MNVVNQLPEILFLTSYPPRECGIATYSQDLIKALNNKFGKSFSISVCALENRDQHYEYPDEVKYSFNTENTKGYTVLADKINMDAGVSIVMIQHEFGFFANHEDDFLQFLYHLTKPVCLTFHTVLPGPDEALFNKVKHIAAACLSIVVMTNSAADLLAKDYDIPSNKIEVIQHGTHLVQHLDKNILKAKHGMSGKKVLSTFGLLSSGKSIETTLDALPSIIKLNPEVVFLIIGKTHPSVFNNEGEAYRKKLEAKVRELKLQLNVRFINRYLPLNDLLEFLQLTDIYLFTSRDPNQAVSGTFSYAMSCGCCIVSTPIPHAKEMLKDGEGFIFDFGNSAQLSDTVNLLLADKELRKNIRLNALHKICPTAYENSAIAHAQLFNKISAYPMPLQYTIPLFNLDHVKKMTTEFGMIQFSKINTPDISSGYTLDDNARALIAMCKHFELTRDERDIEYIKTYFNFIRYCMQTEGYFLNYVDAHKAFTDQNNATNLADANGRAIWALGYLVSMGLLLPDNLAEEAKAMIQQSLLRVNKMHSTRAMAFSIKGLYYYNTGEKSYAVTSLIETLANRLVQMYKHESDTGWEWFEGYLTYANSVLPEALLCAYLSTGETVYKDIAKVSFDFLLSQTFHDDTIQVISNKSWLHKGKEAERHGEQPIDVAYTILALSKFYEVYKDEAYRDKLRVAFNWFHGNNHLKQIIYNPCTGGCYDGLEMTQVNLNQGAESTLSYLLARLTIEKYFGEQQKKQPVMMLKKGMKRQKKLIIN
jgi:glycosyltransferase involved in cell wall biosynthesis